MELPVVATVEIQGTRVQVRAAPFSLVSKLASSAGGPESPGIALQIIERCCRLENGDLVDPDALSMQSASKLVNLAVDGGKAGSDFPAPPGSSGSGG